MDGATLVEAVMMSRRPWSAVGGPQEASGALQHDLDCTVDENHRLQATLASPSALLLASPSAALPTLTDGLLISP